MKYEVVGRYIECFEEDKNVKTAIIFGSGVEFYYNSYINHVEVEKITKELKK